MARGLSEEELDALETGLRELRRAIAAGDFFEAERIVQHPALDAAAVTTLISEIRRLRTLLRDLVPYFSDDMPVRAHGHERAREIRQLQARLSAEVDPPPR